MGDTDEVDMAIREATETAVEAAIQSRNPLPDFDAYRQADVAASEVSA